VGRIVPTIVDDPVTASGSTTRGARGVTTNLNLRGSAGARVAAAHNDQKPVLAAIRANGGLTSSSW
jgi:hypothetical protein